MPKLIFRSNYFKNESVAHKSNYIKYLGTREGVEMNPELMPRFFYEDKDMHGKKENYIDYISGRPGVVKDENMQHGLFSAPGYEINLEQVMDEVANHEGPVWINVISLKREDAERLGLNNIESWQEFIRSHVSDLSDTFNIESKNFRWYAAFHNESYHPHVHLVVYSTDPEEGFLKKTGIEKLKSKFVNDIFKDELKNVYTEKSNQRQVVKEQAKERLLFSLSKMPKVEYNNPEFVMKMQVLSERLKRISGKKVYGYLSRDIKDQVDEIVKMIAEIPEVKDAYDKWSEYQKTIEGYYNDYTKEQVPIWKNQEFRSIANMVIKEALVIGVGDNPTKEDLNKLKALADAGDKNSKSAYYAIVQKQNEEATKDYTANAVARLLNKLEQLMNQSIEGNRDPKRNHFKDKKTRMKERKKKEALGEKDEEIEMRM